MRVEVYFQKIKDQIISSLLNARREIKVAVAWLTDEDIIRVLGQKSDENVIVQVVVSDSKENFKTITKYKRLLQMKAQLFVASPKFLHHKFCIIDNTTIISGSYNWTYYAQSSEENILVLSIDEASKEDLSLLNKFNTKFTYLCEKISIPVIDIGVLNKYREMNKETSTILAQLDEEEIKLREDLEYDVKKSFDEALAIKIPISPLLLDRMKRDGGGVEFIKRILHDEMTSGDMKSGFKKLEEPIPHRVDLSLEYLASRPKYERFFSEEERKFCKNLMAKYGF